MKYIKVYIKVHVYVYVYVYVLYIYYAYVLCSVHLLSPQGLEVPKKNFD